MLQAPGESRLYGAIAELLASESLRPVHERVFGSLSHADSIVRARRIAFLENWLDPETPFSIIQGQPPWGAGISGVLIHALPANQAALRFVSADRTSGWYWCTEATKYLLLQCSGQCGHDDAGRQRFEKAASEVLEDAKRTLTQEGFSFGDVARTWFYIYDIAAQYDVFNAVRNREYGNLGLAPRQGQPLRLPASTAVGATPANGSPLAASFLAAKPQSLDRIRRLSNPGQREAFDYGASFARATHIQERDRTLIYVSGTAAIGQTGQTLYVGDPTGQIDCTLGKLQMLLGAASASLDQAVSANVFVKTPEVYTHYLRIAKARGLENLPAVPVVADLCREDLLFEIDLEVVTSARDDG
jgi:enamine deaminase RidA (YjgF/YER057c/UK114 family)